MQKDSLLRTCRISEKLVRFLMFFQNNGYRWGNRSGSSVTDKKKTGNRIIPAPCFFIEKSVISHPLFSIVLMITEMVCPVSRGISYSIPVCPSGCCLFMLIAWFSAFIVIEEFQSSTLLRAVQSSLLKQKISVLTYSAFTYSTLSNNCMTSEASPS